LTFKASSPKPVMANFRYQHHPFSRN